MSAAMTESATLDGLKGLLAQVTEKRKQMEEMSAKLKALRIEAENLERVAAEQLAGIEGFRCHGKTWWAGIDLHVNCVSANRDKIIAAAKSVDLDAVSVNTSRIKGWLLEEAQKRRDAGQDVEKFAEGTPFEGLVSEYSEKRLYHRSV
jgi:hypothetical protein